MNRCSAFAEGLLARAARERARHLYGIDTQLIEDGTYYVVGWRAAGRLRGWSQRRTLFGGDQYADRSDSRLDPKTEAPRSVPLRSP